MGHPNVLLDNIYFFAYNFTNLISRLYKNNMKICNIYVLDEDSQKQAQDLMKTISLVSAVHIL